MTQETETTTLLQDLEDIVTSLQSGKIDEKQTIEVLNNIVNYENNNIKKLFKIRVRAEYDHIFEIEDNDLESAKDQARDIFLKCMNDEVALTLDVEQWKGDEDV